MTVESVLQDLRYAVRMLWRAPAFSLAAVITVALGIGANTAIFSIVNALLLEPLPFPDADRLVRILEVSENGRLWWPSYPNARDWREHARVFEAVGIGGTLRVEPVVLEGRFVRR